VEESKDERKSRRKSHSSPGRPGQGAARVRLAEEGRHHRVDVLETTDTIYRWPPEDLDETVALVEKLTADRGRQGGRP